MRTKQINLNSLDIAPDDLSDALNSFLIAGLIVGFSVDGSDVCIELDMVKAECLFDNFSERLPHSKPKPKKGVPKDE